MEEIQFQTLRDQWALKAPLPDRETILMYMKIDQQANPHNDTYLNKKPRRSEAEIVSDRAYSYADSVLTQQYGLEYQTWLRNNRYKEVWGVVCRQN